jgi:hypothetical protein
MSYEWIIIGQLRKCLTASQKEKEELVDLNWDERTVWSRKSEF